VQKVYKALEDAVFRPLWVEQPNIMTGKDRFGQMLP
jgi:hypothetical protein